MVIYKPTDEHGFTLVELMLAMAFLSAIILFGILTFVQALAVYNKGISISQINETGRSLTNDLNRSSNNATSFSVSDQIMCIGKTAYLWNDESTAAGSRYKLNGNEIGIVRTVDSIDARDYYCGVAHSHDLVPENVTSLTGSQVKVIDVGVSQPDTAVAEDNSLEAPLLRFVLTIGTRSEDGAVDPIPPGGAGGYWTCPTGTFGTFCAVGTYSTTIYVQSGS